MQESVDYDRLMSLLAELNEEIHTEKEEVRADLGGVSISLNTYGIKAVASSAIDSTFTTLNNYYGQACDYVTELINWVNTNVIGEYRSADENINTAFRNALSGNYSIQRTAAFGNPGEGAQSYDAYQEKLAQYGK